VKDELTIPQQTRYVVGVELGPVEREASRRVTPYVWSLIPRRFTIKCFKKC